LTSLGDAKLTQRFVGPRPRAGALWTCQELNLTER